MCIGGGKEPPRELRAQATHGIHTGPVYRVEDVNDSQNVGGGINIAQRVMDCGEAGHILLSSGYAEVLGQVSAWRPMLYDLGEVEIKHGLRLRFFNLHTEEAGSLALPKKITKVSPRRGDCFLREADLFGRVP